MSDYINSSTKLGEEEESGDVSCSWSQVNGSVIDKADMRAKSDRASGYLAGDEAEGNESEELTASSEEHEGPAGGGEINEEVGTAYLHEAQNGTAQQWAEHARIVEGIEEIGDSDDWTDIENGNEESTDGNYADESDSESNNQDVDSESNNQDVEEQYNYEEVTSNHKRHRVYDYGRASRARL